jgi:hypothetical protein
VEKIVMNYKEDTDMYAPKLSITPIKVDGYNIRNIAASGNNLYNKGLGVGAIITVMRVNQTIPKEKEVVDPSTDLSDLVCRCGTQFTKNDIIGNNFKCSNESCTTRHESLRKRVEKLSDLSDMTKEVFYSYLKLPAFNISRVRDTFSMKELFKFIDEDSYHNLYEYVRNQTVLTNSQFKVLRLNIIAVQNLIKQIFS